MKWATFVYDVSSARSTTKPCEVRDPFILACRIYCTIFSKGNKQNDQLSLNVLTKNLSRRHPARFQLLSRLLGRHPSVRVGGSIGFGI